MWRWSVKHEGTGTLYLFSLHMQKSTLRGASAQWLAVSSAGCWESTRTVTVTFPCTPFYNSSVIKHTWFSSSVALSDLQFPTHYHGLIRKIRAYGPGLTGRVQWPLPRHSWWTPASKAQLLLHEGSCFSSPVEVTHACCFLLKALVSSSCRSSAFLLRALSYKCFLKTMR